ncbi:MULTISPECIES: NAD(P)H-quinone oxidoreductase subunit F [unclassified Picosynechococcus]|uniref:NAD(P)H-quinone oxidoreductase subunit F n=1 Tax=unclassified Picosynechococcus TaxID=3079910 RepID=UPI00000BC260|nr:MULTISPECIES: NAD(P)H-quinone oxidoreductase subunit F [unclassified Picosynechococcus]AAN03542.1 NADH dehydrogenase subunit F4 [Picosynechococcus sp. PCC 7002]ACA99793.1 NADH dehydrogenase subunit F4 [Picosynechococcus sp. PCC 7002]ANV90816.1 NAD(P)H-quinone oxidoreductase subunit F [Picosynechococcus sp. PCC 8807]SMH55797.1 NAD(P)H-quinone oxidoreductase subunit 5 [Picosynechococcus sp. OG1]
MSEFLLQSVWLVPVYGITGALLTLPWSLGLIRRTGPRPAAYLNLIMTFLGLLHGSFAFASLWNMPPQQLSLEWLQVADLNLSLVIEISPVNLGAMELVTGICFMAQLYGLGYLEKDWSIARFYGLMGFFEAALSGLAISDSLLLSYGLLEVLTLSTYLLVGFWYAQPLVVTAARDAFLTKRVGDILLLMGIVALSSYGTGLTFSELETWAANPPLPPWEASLVGLALISGPIGKCAQFPLNLWLDEAMEGPNPAGIIRNSVVVSAGAYVLLKMEPVFTITPITSDALIIIGTVTTVGASLVALAQIDIKRALSHSTSAYLGLVFIAVGLNQVDIALLLLLTHAIAKALLFMSIGAVILNTHGQNITEMGGLWSRMPATTSAFVVGSAGLVCLFPLGTFWTMRRWVDGFWDTPPWLVLLLVGVNFCSSFNLTRVFRSVFLGAPKPKTRRSPEVVWQMAVPMVSLILMTLMVPFFLHQWQLLFNPSLPTLVERPLIVTLAIPALMITGGLGLVAGLTITLNPSLSRPRQLYLRFLQDLLAYDFYIDRIYNVTVVWLVTTLSKLAAWFDRYVVDGFVNLTGLATLFSGSALRYNVSGQSQFYVLTIVLGMILGLVWFMATGQWTMITDFWSNQLA